MLLHLVFYAGLRIPSALLLFLGLLDRTEEREGQPVIRLLEWTGHVPHHLRLGTNRVHWLPSCDPVVG